MYYQISASSFDNYREEQALNFSYGYDESIWNDNYYFPFIYSRIDLLDGLYTIIRDFSYSNNRPENNSILPIILVLGRGEDNSSKSLIQLIELIELIKIREYPLKILILSFTNNSQQCNLYFQLQSTFPEIFIVKPFVFENRWIIIDEILQYFQQNGVQSHFVLGFSNSSEDEKYFYFIKSIYAQILNNYQPQYYCCFILNQSLYRLENQQFILQRHFLENQLQQMCQIKSMQQQVKSVQQPISYQENMNRRLEYINYKVQKKEYDKKQAEDMKDKTCLQQCWQIIQVIFCFILFGLCVIAQWK